MARKIGAFFAGLLVLGAVVMTLQQLASMIYPLPEGVNPMNVEDADAFATHLESMPTAAWALAFISEILGAFAGAVTAGRIAPASARGLGGGIVGLALVGSAMNWAAFAHPIWFIVGQLVLYPVALVGAWALATDGKPAADGNAAA